MNKEHDLARIWRSSVPVTRWLIAGTAQGVLPVLWIALPDPAALRRLRAFRDAEADHAWVAAPVVGWCLFSARVFRDQSDTIIGEIHVRLSLMHAELLGTIVRTDTISLVAETEYPIPRHLQHTGFLDDGIQFESMHGLDSYLAHARRLN